tara:strand:- start:5699 stop:5932 length:234 start_codon:yes stop_codon:yes gene_type:complete
MVKRKTQMIVGYYKNKKQATQAAKDFRKGSMNDIKPFYSIFYRVQKPKKNAKSWKVVSTLRPKSKASNKRARKKRQR